MIVIMFQPRFAPMVKNGTKRHTIRGERKRPVRAGDFLSLREWTDKPYRSPQRILGEAFCTGVRPIRISYSDTFRPVVLDGKLLEPREAGDLAMADGFENGPDMMAWFASTHALPFHGVLISWSIT